MAEGSPQRYFEDVWAGEEISDQILPTTEDVITFIDLGIARTHDGRVFSRSGYFTDPDAARRGGLTRPILPGSMSMALLARLVTDWMGPWGSLRSIDVSFRRPVHHGEQLRAVALVTDASDDGRTPLVFLDVSLENERGEQPVIGTATVQLPRKGTSPQPVD